MKRLGVIVASLVLISGCAAYNDAGTPESGSDAAAEMPTSGGESSPATDGELHTLSVELMTYQGGTAGAREYVVTQAKQACDSINKEVYIDNLTSQTTWRGGMAELTFACVNKDDPRLKDQ